MRKYGKWAGCPNGHNEDTSRCIVEVPGDFMMFHQCGRKRGHGPDGLYCKQHAKMLEQGHNLYIPKAEA